MDFRLALNIKPFQKQLNIRDKVMLVGSCFTDHMSSRLHQHKFKVLENPNGIIFNPASIAQAMDGYINNKTCQLPDLFLFNELWNSWDHHTRFSHPDAPTCLANINESNSKAHIFLQEANWLIITLGSSFVYELNSEDLGGKIGAVAANCHKVPASHFTHRLMQYAEVEAYLQHIATTMADWNPALQIVFTISPVRHYREGLVENNRSKALLHTAVHAMEQQFAQVHYFPSYELVIDDLRDYRFYAEDMVHPNYQATQYVWEKFTAACIDEESRGIMKQLISVHHAKNHRPIHAASVQHQQFLQSMLEKVNILAAQYPFLDLQEEIAYFGENSSAAHT